MAHSSCKQWRHCYRRPHLRRRHVKYWCQYWHLVSHFPHISVNWIHYLLVCFAVKILCVFTCRSNNGGLSLTSVISTVNEQTPSKLGSPWSVALTVTDTNLPSSPSRSNTLLVDTSPVSSSTVNFVPFWFGCCTIEYLTWEKAHFKWCIMKNPKEIYFNYIVTVIT